MEKYCTCERGGRNNFQEAEGKEEAVPRKIFADMRSSVMDPYKE
jgi:hypothetical protein